MHMHVGAQADKVAVDQHAWVKGHTEVAQVRRKHAPHPAQQIALPSSY